MIDFNLEEDLSFSFALIADATVILPSHVSVFLVFESTRREVAFVPDLDGVDAIESSVGRVVCRCIPELDSTMRRHRFDLS